MFGHDLIQFINDPAMEFAGIFPGEDLFSQFFPQLTHCSGKAPSLCRPVPLLLKIVYLTRTQQTRRLKPT